MQYSQALDATRDEKINHIDSAEVFNDDRGEHQAGSGLTAWSARITL
jgi:aryl-alcohol dehydrogenase-like predicted oxidoreductase